ncbi:hypothetical protein [Paludibacterium purpuratum]|uniref:Uncharacterized protein n=1 Tax=Paludibacterium purpuratum TaxID=1144873 RepID=A0A4R7BCI2_9NEIS|nr:hypothetical protein [Paludibacterium purpuratum]TDR82658.1 hypothetical protein DFP86_10143 [Paludibacterium purpuratum]
MANIDVLSVRFEEADDKYKSILPHLTGKFKKLVIEYQCRFSEAEVSNKYEYSLSLNLHAPLSGQAYNLGQIIAAPSRYVAIPNVKATELCIKRVYVIHVLTEWIACWTGAGVSITEYPGCCIPAGTFFVPVFQITLITVVAPRPPTTGVVIIMPPPNYGAYGWGGSCCCRW